MSEPAGRGIFNHGWKDSHGRQFTVGQFCFSARCSKSLKKMPSQNTKCRPLRRWPDLLSYLGIGGTSVSAILAAALFTTSCGAEADKRGPEAEETRIDGAIESWLGYLRI